MLHARTDYDRIQDPALEDPSLAQGSSPIGEDEPVLLFRAHDRHILALAAKYATLLSIDENDVMMESIVAHMKRIEEWQKEHGSKLPDMPKTAARD